MKPIFLLGNFAAAIVCGVIGVIAIAPPFGEAQHAAAACLSFWLSGTNAGVVLGALLLPEEVPHERA